MSFPLGQLVMTSTLHHYQQRYPALEQFCLESLGRHQRCDWGSCSAQDQYSNQLALEGDCGRILSVYPLPMHLKGLAYLPDDRIWILTYPGHSTTLLFPSEY